MSERLKPRAFTMPLAAFTMAGILIVYARYVMRIAKERAQSGRDSETLTKVSWRHQPPARQIGQRDDVVTGWKVEESTDRESNSDNKKS